MSTSTTEPQNPLADDVEVTEEALKVDLADGRTIFVPTSWYLRLYHGTLEERRNWRLIGRGEGIHWPDLDEDISVRNLLLGKPSSESHRSLKRWLETRKKRAA
ncbi:MAG: DUF2442 domain-containing protein [bacterium]|nr:DUF2442 domain-containing protein [bacterium]